MDYDIDINSCCMPFLNGLLIEFALPKLFVINILLVSKKCLGKLSNNVSEVWHNRKFVMII